MKTGTEIRINRIRKGLKAIDLAKEIGITNVKLSLIENCHIECPEELYEKIEMALKGK